MIEPNPQHQIGKTIDTERLDQFRRFLTHSPPKGQENYWNDRKQLLGPEISTAITEREDGLANTYMVIAMDEMLTWGQTGLARSLALLYVNDKKGTMSIEGKFIEKLLQHKIEYEQTQAVHEYVHPPEKKGWLQKKA